MKPDWAALRYEMLRWAAYRSIKHASMRFYVSMLPLALCIPVTVLWVLLPVKPSLTATSGGMLASILTMVAALPGFFIAALAAVATFNKPEMDEEMPAPCPQIRVLRAGKFVDVSLTRRTFLTYLFAYLSVLSLLLAGYCIAGQLLGPTAIHWIESASFVTWKKLSFGLTSAVYIFGLTYLIATMLVATLHGIYFIAERMHQPH